VDDDLVQVGCEDCGAPYGEDGWCDAVIPDAIWNSLGAGLLCFRCMTKRLQASFYENVPVLIASGPYNDSQETWRLLGWEHGHKVGTQEAADALARKDAEIDELVRALKLCTQRAERAEARVREAPVVQVEPPYTASMHGIGGIHCVTINVIGEDAIAIGGKRVALVLHPARFVGDAEAVCEPEGGERAGSDDQANGGEVMLIATKQIFLGHRIWLACDGDCDRAWGHNWHGPKGDKAPADPGTYEGDHAKPADKCHNKWCARECERSAILSRGDHPADLEEVRIDPW
jgi:hypothetical protein